MDNLRKKSKETIRKYFQDFIQQKSVELSNQLLEL